MRFLTLLFGIVLAGSAPSTAAETPMLAWQVAAAYPHDVEDFTQGLQLCGDQLLESDGLYGHSRISLRPLAGGAPTHVHSLPPHLFGEGAACTPQGIVQLTWREHVILRYDQDLEPLQQVPYPHEGWGLAYDGKRLIASDGSNRIRFLDLATFTVTGHVDVFDGQRPITLLNELEWADGALWANVFGSPRIARIDLASGQVSAWLDLTMLVNNVAQDPDWKGDVDGEDVLNGIAYDASEKRFLITGKRWPRIYAITVDDPASSEP